jgi:alkylresorcinol/alkylpyrone synthase
MFITALGTAVPERSFTQRECSDALDHAKHAALTPRTRAVLKGILNHDNGIERRSLALADLAEGFVLDPDTLHQRFVAHAPRLAAQAARAALAEAGLHPHDVDGVVISTCTGYLCPGLTSYVAEALGLRADVVALDLVGQGCGAALPNLRTCEALLASGERSHVVSICVEVCSAAMYLDQDLGVLVSACLFGDGAAAAICSREPRAAAARNVKWLAAASLTDPAQREALRFEQRGGMLRNILTLPVPQLAGQYAKRVLDGCLAAQGVAPDRISGWMLHAGGRKVLAELQARIGLDAGNVRFSSAILREYGNLSSPFVLFVLAAALRQGAPGGLWWLSSFGAGFSCHGALLEVA